MKRKSRARKDSRSMRRELVRWAGDHRRVSSAIVAELAKIDLAAVLPVRVPRSLRHMVKVRRGGLPFTSSLKLAYLQGHVYPRPMYTRSPLFGMLRRDPAFPGTQMATTPPNQ